MKRMTVLHKKAFWIAMFAALPIPFIVAAKMQNITEVREYVRVERARQREVERRIGPDVTNLIPLKSWRSWTQISQDAYSFRPISNAPGSALNAPPLKELVDCLKAETAGLIAEFANVAQRGIYADSVPAFVSKDNPWKVPSSDAATYLCGIFARQSAALGQTSEAIGFAGQALTIFNAMRVPTRSNPWRQQAEPALQTYEDLLRFGISVEDCRVAAQQLESFATHLAQSLGAGLPDNFPDESDYSAKSRYLDLSLLSTALYHSYARNGRVLETDHGPFQQDTFLPWTAPRGHLVHLRRMSAGKYAPPGELVEAMIPGASPGPVIRALQFYNANPAFFSSAAVVTRRTLSRVRVLQAAYAARAYYLSNGRWPETIEMLGPSIAHLGNPPVERTVSGVDEWERHIINMSLPFGPVKMGIIPVGITEFEALLGTSVMPQHTWGQGKENKFIITPAADGNNRLHAELFFPGRALSAASNYSRLKAIEKTFPTTVTLNVVPDAQTRKQNSDLPSIESELWATALSDDVKLQTPCKKVVPTAGLFRPNDSFRMEVEMNIPQQAFAVWIDSPTIPPKPRHGYFPPAGRVIVFPQQIYR